MQDFFLTPLVADFHQIKNSHLFFSVKITRLKGLSPNIHDISHILFKIIKYIVLIFFNKGTFFMHSLSSLNLFCAY